MIRRINFWGGPGSGKSTGAAKMFHMMKTMILDGDCDYRSVELVREVAKEYAWTGNDMSHELTQGHVTAVQMNREHTLLYNDVDIVITDSPVGLGELYCYENGTVAMGNILGLVSDRVESHYPSYNIFIERRDRTYDNNGRFQSEEEARALDESIFDYLKKKHQGFVILSLEDDIQVWESTILEILNKED